MAGRDSLSLGMGLVIFATRLMDGASAEALCLIAILEEGALFSDEMNTKLKYLPIAAFAAIALTLAGCGGGGGGGGPVTSSTWSSTRLKWLKPRKPP